MRKIIFMNNKFKILFLIFIILSLQSQAQNRCENIFGSYAIKKLSLLELENYANNYIQIIPAVQYMINLGLSTYSQRSPSGYCYRAVKQLLIESGLVKKTIDGTFASSAHTKNFLANRGFINLLERAPFNQLIKGALDEHIPVGAILVYSGTNGLNGGYKQLGEGIGHIEVKCGSNCYLFDSVQEFPGGKNQFTSENVFEAGAGADLRKLIGVYILDYFSIF